MNFSITYAYNIASSNVCFDFPFFLHFRNSGRQLVGPNDPQPFRTLHDDSDHTVDIMDNRIEDIELDEDKDDGILDAILGEGAQSRIVTQVSDWLVDKATSNPGCVERFVCETYRTGESLNGIPYGVMQLTKWVVLAFSSNFCPIKSDLFCNTIWPQDSGFQKLAKKDHFWHF